MEEHKSKKSGLLQRALSAENKMPGKSMGLLARVETMNNKKLTYSLNPISEKNGIYTIKQNMDTSNVVQDPEFKELVDSVLKR